MKVVSNPHPSKYAWRAWCPACGATLEVQAGDMTWVRTQRDKRGKPELLMCGCESCGQPIYMSVEKEYRYIPKVVLELIKLMTAERKKPKVEPEVVEGEEE